MRGSVAASLLVLVLGCSAPPEPTAEPEEGEWFGDPGSVAFFLDESKYAPAPWLEIGPDGELLYFNPDWERLPEWRAKLCEPCECSCECSEVPL